MTISPETEKTLTLIGKVLGLIIFKLICYTISSGLLYAILVLMIGLPITYLQVLGSLIIISTIKNWFVK